MKNTASFAQLKKEYLNVLKQYIPIVDRVHGSNHPEFHEVRRIFENMNKQMEQADVKSTELQEFFSQLRRSTQDYRIPEDVCESYEAVYRMLSELDETYHRSE
ncbi:iron-sulfur cluster repair di-iron protein, ric [Sphaerochaeta halotolerans]|jgi:regulator of cell morphogenesis and NO signaling|uniref:Iron-sulfur cluster repair di-iron protein, ric n=1 Tax=Sphaerochaeta halotolerans TaxID=2293840 RepID=A0A372MLL5_9SPIR|nr:iron-sulfur cluster repair di-iron protein, ric [Sphaerochaeta halotolerans]MBG0767764.1 iron-sulfur cluster repair di-iron protein, ric [Spirochaetaceae bacterium]MXI86915.1 iron-sulfur cluster repair di-iron protein, ric [Sphaerochaeta halotolerans]RFU96293.1 iron-sulfur cluster repair di-iron protein, ric [Sphaerochaeta halotolerans]